MVETLLSLGPAGEADLRVSDCDKARTSLDSKQQCKPFGRFSPPLLTIVLWSPGNGFIVTLLQTSRSLVEDP